MAMQICLVQFTDSERPPIRIAAFGEENPVEVMCRIFELFPPLTAERAGGISSLRLLRKDGRPGRRIWPP